MLDCLHIVFEVVNAHEEISNLLIGDRLHVLVQLSVNILLYALAVNIAQTVSLWRLLGNQLNKAEVGVSLDHTGAPAHKLIFVRIFLARALILVMQIYLTTAFAL